MNEVLQAIEMVGREKGLSREVVVSALEEAMVAAARKVLKTKEQLVGHFNPDSGEVEIFKIMIVVEDDISEEDYDPTFHIKWSEAYRIAGDIQIGDELEFPLETTPQMGRIAAQQAKQVLTQKIREAEREIIFNEFKEKVGTIINGIVKRIERGNYIVDIGRTEAILPISEQVRRTERFSQGERIRALIVEVRDQAKGGNQVVLSRSRPEFVSKLFFMEVPEIYDGTVMIKGVARDPGERTKMAVIAKDKEIDPIGACIGMRGMRVQAVTRELRGEKIDIIAYKEEISEYVRAALAPAVITRVEIVDNENKKMEIIVADEQLSLCIGKKGHNVKLAGELVGWELSVKSESAKKEELLAVMGQGAVQGDETSSEEKEKERQMASLPDIPGVPLKAIEELVQKGLVEKAKILEMSDEELMKLPQMNENALKNLRNWAEEE
ncbi:MAG: transcription termination factor NusA [Thermoanaerobaculaceae bacterium]|nr:transcription termination factor NusA [Thermoanaerobaculaceae bacterium]